MRRLFNWAREIAWFNVLAAVLLLAALAVMFFNAPVALVLAVSAGVAAVLGLRS